MSSSSPLRVIDLGMLHAELFQSSARGLSVEFSTGSGGYSLSVFPHELRQLKLLIELMELELKRSLSSAEARELDPPAPRLLFGT